MENRSVYPGISTGVCDPDVYQEVNCGFATQIYARYAANYYGVDTCVEDNLFKYSLKKSILDLALIDDPNYCKPIVCPKPCLISVTLIISTATVCQPVKNVTVTYSFTPVNCLPPHNISTSLNYQ